MKMIFFYFFENVIMIVDIRMNQYVKHALSWKKIYFLLD